MLHHLADAADSGGAAGGGDGIGVDDSESEVGLEEGMHHDAVPELEYLQRKNGAGEEDEGEREEGELNDIVLGRRVRGVHVVVLLGEGGGGAAEGGGDIRFPAAEERETLRR